MFIMGTVLAVVQFVALGIAAEYTLNYMSSFVGDELVLSPLSSRIALASFFVGVSGLLGLTRWYESYLTHYVTNRHTSLTSRAHVQVLWRAIYSPS
jgi:hypothetical protein